MSNFAESMVQSEPWAGLMMGNHALVRAMLEAGVMVATHYPGSPTPEIADAILAIPEDQRRIHFEYSSNEKVALETAFGASINGHLSTVFFKSVGLNVALDSAVQLSLLELRGGMVIILGDDPGANSSQNEQDNRHIARLAYTPVFEPATPSEAYAMFKEAAELSHAPAPAGLPADDDACLPRARGGAVRRHPAARLRLDAALRPGLPRLLADHRPTSSRSSARRWPSSRRWRSTPRPRASPKWSRPTAAAPAGAKRRGVITCGLPAMAVYENLAETGAALDVLKLGITYPLPRSRVLEFHAGARRGADPRRAGPCAGAGDQGPGLRAGREHQAARCGTTWSS